VTGDTQSPEQRLARQGLTLPDPPAAVAALPLGTPVEVEAIAEPGS
jgi:hypothetical protein